MESCCGLVDQLDFHVRILGGRDRDVVGWCLSAEDGSFDEQANVVEIGNEPKVPGISRGALGQAQLVKPRDAHAGVDRLSVAHAGAQEASREQKPARGLRSSFPSQMESARRW